MGNHNLPMISDSIGVELKLKPNADVVYAWKQSEIAPHQAAPLNPVFGVIAHAEGTTASESSAFLPRQAAHPANPKQKKAAVKSSSQQNIVPQFVALPASPPAKNIHDVGFWGAPADTTLLPQGNTAFEYFMSHGKLLLGSALTAMAVMRYGKPIAKALKFIPQAFKNAKGFKPIMAELRDGTKHVFINPDKPVGKFFSTLFKGQFRSSWKALGDLNPHTRATIKAIGNFEFKNFGASLKNIWIPLSNTLPFRAVKEVWWWTSRTVVLFTAPAVVALGGSQAAYFGTREQRISKDPIDLDKELPLLRENPDDYMRQYWKTTGVRNVEGTPYANGVLVQLDMPLSDVTPLVRRLPEALIDAMKADIRLNGANSKFKLGTKGEILTEEPVKITRAESTCNSDGTISEQQVTDIMPMLVAYVGPYRNNPGREIVSKETYAERSTENSYSRRYKWSVGPFDGHKFTYTTEKTFNYAYSASAQTILQSTGATSTQMPNVNLRQQKTTYLVNDSKKLTFWDGDLSNVRALQETQYDQYQSDFTMGAVPIYSMGGTRERHQLGYLINAKNQVPGTLQELNPMKSIMARNGAAEAFARITGYYEVGAMATLFTYKSKNKARYTMDFYCEPIQMYPGGMRLFWKQKEGIGAMEPSWNPVNIEFAYRIWTSENSYMPEITNHFSAPSWQEAHRPGLPRIISAEPVSDKVYQASLLRSM